MRISFLLFFLFLFGCSSKKSKVVNLEVPPPPPPPNILPPSDPPSFIPSLDEVAEIQVNPIPHPFNLNGHFPYAVWVDGQRLKLTPQEMNQLIVALDLKFEQPKNTKNIHNGEGWLYPLDRNESTKKENAIGSARNTNRHLPVY
jgi:hypothetical protein